MENPEQKLKREKAPDYKIQIGKESNIEEIKNNYKTEAASTFLIKRNLDLLISHLPHTDVMEANKIAKDDILTRGLFYSDTKNLILVEYGEYEDVLSEEAKKSLTASLEEMLK